MDKHAKRGVHLSGLNNRRNGPPRPIVFTSGCCEASGRVTMKKSLFALLLLAFTADFLVQFPARVFAGPAEEVQAAMQLLKSKAATLGAPGVKGEEPVAGKTVPSLLFGATKMNNNFVLVGLCRKQRSMPRSRDSLRPGARHQRASPCWGVGMA